MVKKGFKVHYSRSKKEVKTEREKPTLNADRTFLFIHNLRNPQLSLATDGTPFYDFGFIVMN